MHKGLWNYKNVFFVFFCLLSVFFFNFPPCKVFCGVREGQAAGVGRGGGRGPGGGDQPGCYLCESLFVLHVHRTAPLVSRLRRRRAVF